MAQPVWLVSLIKKTFPNRFRAAELTKTPVLGRLIDHWLFAGDDIIYLPKDHIIPINQSFARPEQVVLPSQVVEHFVQQANYHWIMNACICRDASHCQNYPIDLGCLFLGQAALGINPKLGHAATKDEALEHVRRARQAGLVHLIGRNKLDTVWLGVHPGEKLMTICNCCPCCCLWRMLPNVAPGIGAKVSRMPGVRVQITDACIGCGACTQGTCFVKAIQMEGEQAVIGDACRGCGRCVDICPVNAIELVIEDTGFVDKSIQRLSALVDVR